jgi:hypothetical protein
MIEVVVGTSFVVAPGVVFVDDMVLAASISWISSFVSHLGCCNCYWISNKSRRFCFHHQWKYHSLLVCDGRVFHNIFDYLFSTTQISSSSLFR